MRSACRSAAISRIAVPAAPVVTTASSGCGPRRQNQHVVFLTVAPARNEIAHIDLPRAAVDRQDFILGAHLDVETLAEKLRCGDKQLRLVLNHVAHVIGQTAVRKGNVRLRSRSTISTCSSSRRKRAAHDAPPATPPTMNARFAFVMSFPHFSPIAPFQPMAGQSKSTTSNFVSCSTRSAS